MDAQPMIARNQSGFTLIEMLIAVVILAFVLMGVGAATGRLIKDVEVHDQQTAAIQLAQDRLALIQLDPAYDSLPARYEGVEDSFPTRNIGLVRRTEEIVRIGGPGDSLNHRKITVTIDGPGLPAPVARTISVAAP